MYGAKTRGAAVEGDEQADHSAAESGRTRRGAHAPDGEGEEKTDAERFREEDADVTTLGEGERQSLQYKSNENGDEKPDEQARLQTIARLRDSFSPWSFYLSRCEGSGLFSGHARGVRLSRWLRGGGQG